MQVSTGKVKSQEGRERRAGWESYLGPCSLEGTSAQFVVTCSFPAQCLAHTSTVHVCSHSKVHTKVLKCYLKVLLAHIVYMLSYCYFLVLSRFYSVQVRQHVLFLAHTAAVGRLGIPGTKGVRTWIQPGQHTLEQNNITQPTFRAHFKDT